jgi:flagellar biosynthesis protein FlhF
MKIKSYFARTVEDAMAEARVELGPEAILVDTRKPDAQAGGLGEYEVVFASETAAREGEAADAAEGRGARPVGERLCWEVAELKRELEGMRRALMRSAFAPAWSAPSRDLSDAYAVLTANEVAPDLAREIVEGAASRAAAAGEPAERGGPRTSGRAFQKLLADEVGSRVAVDASLGQGEESPRIVALVGPPGSGKTATLVKLAVNYGLAVRRPTLLLTVDTYRVAAAEQLHSYAAILGVGFQKLETATALAQAIEENRGKELIFIDTPGLGFDEMEEAHGLARLLSSRGDIDTHLALPASMKSGDLERVVDCYEAFRPRRLLFTKLDETASFGPILNQAARTGKPLSFFGRGQRIPEDLETASRERVSELVLRGRAERAQSAA